MSEKLVFRVGDHNFFLKILGLESFKEMAFIRQWVELWEM